MLLPIPPQSSGMGGALPTSFLLIPLLLLFVMRPSQAMSAIVMDGLAEWRGPVVQVGDSLVFGHKDHLQNLYLFHNRRAFDRCSFSQAALIYDGSKSTHFTWHPARPGFYYFSTRDSSGRRCEKGEKLLVRVITPDPSTGFPPTVVAPFPTIALPPTGGGDLPSNGWAIGPPSSSPTPAPEAASPSGPLLPRNGHAPSDAPMPDSGGGIPFISSNPAVPLPSDDTDSATILPLPSPGDRNRVTGLGSTVRVGTSWIMLVMMAFFGTCV